MSYGGIDTLLLQFGRCELEQLAPALDGQEGSLDEARLGAALIRASAEADSYLRVRYAVPVSADGAANPEPLTSFVGDMARYHLSGGDAQESDPIARRYQESLAWLRAVAAGTVDLPFAADNGGGADDNDGLVGDLSGSVAFYPGKRVWL
jgi:phage gp36-like protein